MADIKISQLGAAIAVGDTDLVPIVSGGNTLKATAAQVKEHSIGNTNISSIGDGSVTGAISTLNTDKQPKTLDTPLTIGGVSKTTVEAALDGLVSENQTLKNNVYVGNYIIASNGTGDTDLEKLQYCVDNYGYVILDRDYTINAPLQITTPTKLNLGGYRLEGASNSDDVIEVYCSNVEIFNGEIYNTVTTPENTNYGGKCVHVPNFWGTPYVYPPVIKNIKLHDLYTSTNGNITIDLSGECSDCEIYNVIVDGNRSNKGTFSIGIASEWHGTPHVDTYHPHNIKIYNCALNHFTYGVRYAGAFNIEVSNINIYECINAIELVTGDWGNEAAQAKYKEAVNKNLHFRNINIYDCNTGLDAVHNTYGHVEFVLEDSVIYSNVANQGQGVRITGCENCIIRNVEMSGLVSASLTNGAKNIVFDNCNIHDMDNYALYILNDENISIINCKINNVNQSGNTTTPTQDAVAFQSATKSRIENCVIGFGASEGAVNDIVSIGSNDYTIVKNNIYKNTLSFTSTNTIVDDNLQAT